MPTIKGEKVTWKEFFSRWKHGMEQITPLQQAQTTQFGMFISFVGVIWGIIFSARIKYYWMMTVLIGGFVVLSTQFLGNWQRKRIFRRMEDAIKEQNYNIQGVKENGD